MKENSTPLPSADNTQGCWAPDVLDSDQLVENILSGGPPETLDDLPLYIRDDLARFPVPHPFNPDADGLESRLKTAVCVAHWSVPAEQCGLLRLRSLRNRETVIYVVEPKLWQSLVANAHTPDDRVLFVDLLWRGGVDLFKRVMRRAPFVSRKPPVGTPEFDMTAPIHEITVATAFYDMLLHRLDGENLMLVSQLGPLFADDDILTTMAVCLDGFIGTPTVAPVDGGMLYKRQDVERAMKRGLFGNPETKERLKSFYSGLLESGGARRLQPPPDHDALKTLREDFPNFAGVVDFIAGQCSVARRNGTPLAWPPILLFGPPGIGKTEFSHALADACALGDEDREIMSLGTASAGFIVTGSSPSWGGGKSGMLLSRMLASQVLNPLVLLDEVDKAVGSQQFPVDQVLLGLLESTTAKNFVDEWAGIPVDVSHVLWVATANDIDRISAPVRSRLYTFRIQPLDDAQTRHVAQRMHETMAPRGMDPLDDAVLARLGRMTPRRIRLSLLSAYGSCSLRDGNSLEPCDLEAPAGFVPDEDDAPSHRHIGFL